MRFDVFYCCYERDLDVPGSDPVPHSSEEIWPLASRLLLAPDDFFGVVDAVGTTIQVIVDENRGYWTEVPAPSEGGSYGAELTGSEVQGLLEDLPEHFTHSVIPRARFCAW